MNDNIQADRIIKKVFSFIKPIEENFTGIGLPALFSFLANLTGLGVIATAPMGSGKTLIAKILEELFAVSQMVDYIVVFQEFKKMDWIRIFKKRIYKNESFFFSVPEISAMSPYSQEMFLEKIPALQSDGFFEYSYGKENNEVIKMENCKASYFIASQPPKTSHLINNTTFKTLAQDRCFNILIINQLRGRKNTSVQSVKDIIAQITWTKKNKKTGVEVKKYFSFPFEQVKFKGKNNKTVDFITDSILDYSQLEGLTRSQFSVDRREQRMNDIIKIFASFCNQKTVNQTLIDVFVSLFGFYIELFNKLTLGTVEQGISIKYGSMEMLCRISALIGRNKVITQNLLCSEFNTTEDDINLHLNSLINSSVLYSKKNDTNIPVIPVKPLRFSKSSKGVRNTVQPLEILGLIKSRRAKMTDLSTNNDDVSKNEIIYEFTSEINDFFRIYATILLNYISPALISQVKVFLEKSNPDLSVESQSRDFFKEKNYIDKDLKARIDEQEQEE